jgi:hypothetical protein
MGTVTTQKAQHPELASGVLDESFFRSANQRVTRGTGLPVAATTATAPAAAALAAATTAAAAEAATAAAAEAATAATTTTEATATAAAEAATTAAATKATTTTAAGLTRTCLVNDEGATAQLLTVHSVDRGIRLGIVRHFDKAKAAGAAGLTIHHDGRGSDFTVGLKGLTQFGVGRAEREITNIKLLHT